LIEEKSHTLKKPRPKNIAEIKKKMMDSVKKNVE